MIVYDNFTYILQLSICVVHCVASLRDVVVAVIIV